MPDRFIREKINSSEKVCSLDWAAEVFFRRLLNRADDYARFTADPALLRVELYPRQVDKVRLADCSRWLAECETAGLLAQYKATDGKPLLVIPQFDQRIRAEKSKWGVPTKELVDKHKLPVAKGETPQMSDGCQTGVGQMHVAAYVNDKRETETGAETDDEVPPPVFEELIRPLYRKTGEGMIKDAEREIKRIEENSKAWVWKTADDVQEFIDEIKAEKKEGWMEKVQQAIQNPANYEKLRLRKTAQIAVDSWKVRIAEIRKAMNGVK